MKEGKMVSLQAGVVGLSCRSDVAEMLEKRVKSRFSYRRQLVLDPSTSDFNNEQEGPCAILFSLLCLQLPEDCTSEDGQFAACLNRSTKAALSDENFRARMQRLCDYGESFCIFIYSYCLDLRILMIPSRGSGKWRTKLPGDANTSRLSIW